MAKINYFLKKVFITIIQIYRLVKGSLLGYCCRFDPSCSLYAIEAIKCYGCLKGSYLAVKRLLRCHPWHPGGVDPIP